MRNLLLFSVCILLCFGVRSLILNLRGEDETEVETSVVVSDGGEEAPTKPQEKPRVDLPIRPIKDVQKLLSYARSLEGAPYAAGGQSPSGFDCSGYVRHVFFESMGKTLPRSSQGQSKAGKEVSLSELQPGDLLFFTGSDASSGEIGHVALVLDAAPTRIEMIHSSSSRGIVSEDMYSVAYYRDRYITARRVLTFN